MPAWTREAREVTLKPNDACVIFRADGSIEIVTYRCEAIVGQTSPIWQAGRVRMMYTETKGGNAMRERADAMLREQLPPPMTEQ